MTAPVHSVRNSLIDKERHFTLGDDALRWSETGGAEGHMPYADIRDMRLIAYTSPIGGALQCTLRSKSGGKVKLRSAHYRSLNNFEDRSATYGPFVSALAERVAEATDAKFIAGSTGLWLLWLIVGLLFLGLVVVLVLSMFEGLPPAGPWVIAIAVCLIAVPWVWLRLREGKAETFDPEAPPPALLGQR
jgi:hypothetical protein